MSRANAPISPTPEFYDEKVVGVTGGLTIREHAYFQIMAAIIASGRPGSSVVLEVAAQAREYVDAGLDELAQEPRR